MQMRDSEVVASIVAGDPQGLASAYDRHADSLYTYCRSLLRDPADAADAAQDTFVIAASRLDGLRDPDRLRSWLYAVARNECTRILRAKKSTTALDEAPDVIDESADAERAELRTLFLDASEGLGASERELIELSLRHKMEADEIADVLGVSKNHAHSLLSRARGQLEACLGVLLVGRAGRDECKELASLLGEWDGKLTVPLRKRLHRHIEGCATCAERRAFELRPAAFSGLPPLVAIAGTLRILAIPAAIKTKVLALATGTDPAAAAHRAAVVHHAGSFNHRGFPHAVHAGKAGALHVAGTRTGAFLKSPQGRGTAAAALIAVVAAATTLALTGNSEHLTLSISKPGHSNGGGSISSTHAASGAAGSGGSHNSSRNSSHDGGSGSGAKLETTQPSPAAVGSTYEPSPATSVPAKSPASSAPGRDPIPPPASSPPAPTLPPTPSGTFTAKPGGGLLTIPPGGTTIMLTNSGSAKAYWTMTVSGGSGAVQVFPASGWLGPGASVAVRVTTTGGAALGQTITLAPGGTSWTVLLGL